MRSHNSLLVGIAILLQAHACFADVVDLTCIQKSGMEFLQSGFVKGATLSITVDESRSNASIRGSSFPLLLNTADKFAWLLPISDGLNPRPLTYRFEIDRQSGGYQVTYHPPVPAGLNNQVFGGECFRTQVKRRF
jgi:hypothetical protein